MEFIILPNYEYRCNNCNVLIEAKLPMSDYLLPEQFPCPECNLDHTVHIYLSSPPAIGDPIKLGITKPPKAFLEGVLGRMQENVPDGGLLRDSSGKIQVDNNGRPKYKKVSFSKAHYQPGRTI